MTAFTRIVAIVSCLLLLSASDALGAGKRKPNHNKLGPIRPNHVSPTKAAPTNAPEAPPSRSPMGTTTERAADKGQPVRESVRQESRIEFDERMLRGQSAAGVIYLFQRTPSDWKSIVEVPGSFRSRTISVVSPAEDKK